MSDLGDFFKAMSSAKKETEEKKASAPAAVALRGLQERIKKNNNIAQLMEVYVENKPIVKEVIKEVIVEKEVIKEQESFQQPNPPEVDANIKSIQLKLKFLEQAIGRIATTGPGGGAGDVVNLDHPTTLITTSSYTVGRKDYYVGVNYAGPVTLTVPSTTMDGRRIIIKDESGRCSVYPITVQGTVDNDPAGFILAVNNGAIQMIYRNGWRIV